MRACVHNNSVNASTQWIQHVSEKSTRLINKATPLIDIDLKANRNQLTASVLPCSYTMSQFAAEKNVSFGVFWGKEHSSSFFSRCTHTHTHTHTQSYVTCVDSSHILIIITQIFDKLTLKIFFLTHMF